jgi:4a-hydroxytetrahydrobiopterin dehydratase
MSDLSNKKCIPCEDKSVQPYDAEKAGELLIEVPGWNLSEDHKKISREFVFPDFIKSIDFVSGSVSDIAEGEGHHPDIHISYNKVLLELYTHSIGGLSENDFIVASKVNQAYDNYKKFGI